MKRLLWLSVAVFAISCGGSSGSGVSSSKLLVDLSVSEEDDLCNYIVDVEDAPRTVTCSDGSTVTLEESTDCDFSGFTTSCTATVGDAEDCAQALGNDPCNPDLSACIEIIQCAIDGSGAAPPGRVHR